MAAGDQDYRCGMACGRVVPCGLYVVPYGTRQVWPDLPANYVEAQPIPMRDPVAGYRFRIGDVNTDAIRERHKRKWRANRWER